MGFPLIKIIPFLFLSLFLQDFAKIFVGADVNHPYALHTGNVDKPINWEVELLQTIWIKTFNCLQAISTASNLASAINF